MLFPAPHVFSRDAETGAPALSSWVSMVTFLTWARFHGPGRAAEAWESLVKPEKPFPPPANAGFLNANKSVH